MADVNYETLNTINRTLSKSFQAGLLANANTGFMDIVTMVNSDSRSNFYGWLKDTFQVREWLGARRFREIESETFEVVNKKWEHSFRIKQDEIEDDKLGTYDMRMAMLARAWQLHKLKEATFVLLDNDTSFTGQSIISNSHTYGSNTIDNLVTTSLSSTALDAADAAAGGYKMESGEPTFTRWDTLMVGPTLEHTAHDLIVNRFTNDSTAQIENSFFGGRMRLIVNPYLTANSGSAGTVDAEHHWYLFDTSQGINAVAMQIRKDVEMVIDTDPAQVQRTGNVDVMCSSRYSALPTFPHLCYGAQATS